MTDRDRDRLNERAAEDIESRLESRRVGAAEAGRTATARATGMSFRTFSMLASVVVLAVALLVTFWLPEAPDSVPADPEDYWVRSNDSVRGIVARHVSRDSPVEVDRVLEALSTLSPEELRDAGIPVTDLRYLALGHTIDSVRLRHFVETEFGADVVRRAAADDLEYYMLRSNDTLSSILARVISGESPVDVGQVLDALRSLSHEELQNAGMPGRPGELRFGDEINVVDLRRFIERLSR